MKTQQPEPGTFLPINVNGTLIKLVFSTIHEWTNSDSVHSTGTAIGPRGGKLNVFQYRDGRMVIFRESGACMGTIEGAAFPKSSPDKLQDGDFIEIVDGKVRRESAA